MLNYFTKAFTAGADLSSKLYYLARISGDNQVDLGNATTRPIGVIVEPAESNKAVGVAVSGIVKVIAGGQISAGDLIVSNASGKAIARTSENAELICGMAWQSASADGNEILIKIL